VNKESDLVEEVHVNPMAKETISKDVDDIDDIPIGEKNFTPFDYIQQFIPFLCRYQYWEQSWH
jgi:hypothetical protein